MITHLIEVAEKINAFGKQFTGKHYSAPAKAWKFNPDCALAGVGASVCDSEGSIEAGQSPVGQIRLNLDIEFFRHDKTPQNAEAAESEVIAYAATLGFVAERDGSGSGEYGPIACYSLSAI